MKHNREHLYRQAEEEYQRLLEQQRIRLPDPIEIGRNLPGAIAGVASGLIDLTIPSGHVQDAPSNAEALNTFFDAYNPGQPIQVTPAIPSHMQGLTPLQQQMRGVGMEAWQYLQDTVSPYGVQDPSAYQRLGGAIQGTLSPLESYDAFVDQIETEPDWLIDVAMSATGIGLGLSAPRYLSRGMLNLADRLEAPYARYAGGGTPPSFDDINLMANEVADFEFEQYVDFPDVDYPDVDVGVHYNQPQLAFPRAEKYPPTPSQQRALEHTFGPAVTVAGPGSGKSRALIERLKYLTNENLATPDDVLTLVFGKKAQLELMERVREIGGDWNISTLDAFAYNLVRENYGELGYSGVPRITTETFEQWFSRNADRFEERGMSVKESWASQYEDLRSTFVTGEEDYTSLAAPLQEIIKEYRLEKLRANELDFTDAMLQSRYLLETNADLRRSLREKYQFVQVDEFQDVSLQQYSLLSQLSSNLWAVGDLDQSIMSFRGGAGEVMQDLIRQGASFYNIEENFRSRADIVEASQGFIAPNFGRMEINQRALKPAGDSVELVGVPTWTKQEDVFDALLQHIDPGQETAILTRTVRERDRFKREISSRLAESGWSDEALGNLHFETLHGSKGREWDHVILPVNVLDKQFSKSGGRDITLPTRHAKTAQELAEEERLFYVGMTRAMDQLTILGDPHHPYLSRLRGTANEAADAGVGSQPTRQSRQPVDRGKSGLENYMDSLRERLDRRFPEDVTFSENLSPRAVSVTQGAILGGAGTVLAGAGYLTFKDGFGNVIENASMPLSGSPHLIDEERQASGGASDVNEVDINRGTPLQELQGQPQPYAFPSGYIPPAGSQAASPTSGALPEITPEMLQAALSAVRQSPDQKQNYDQGDVLLDEGYLYRLYNIESQRAYVGLSLNHPLEQGGRIRQHLSGTGSKAIERVLGTYDADDFQAEYWQLSDLGYKELAELEKYAIEQTGSFGGGYNLTPGGEIGFVSPDRLDLDFYKHPTAVSDIAYDRYSVAEVAIETPGEVFGDEGYMTPDEEHQLRNFLNALHRRAPTSLRRTSQVRSDTPQLQHIPFIPYEDRIDINQARNVLLEEIPGIGRRAAEQIDIFTDRFGPIRSIETLTEFSGISASDLQNIRRYISPLGAAGSEAAFAPTTAIQRPAYEVPQGLDINEATLQQLANLRGIGTTTAQRILESRASHGEFPSLESLTRVQGVGTGTVNRLRPFLEDIGLPDHPEISPTVPGYPAPVPHQGFPIGYAEPFDIAIPGYERPYEYPSDPRDHIAQGFGRVDAPLYDSRDVQDVPLESGFETSLRRYQDAQGGPTQFPSGAASRDGGGYRRRGRRSYDLQEGLQYELGALPQRAGQHFLRHGTEGLDEMLLAYPMDALKRQGTRVAENYAQDAISSLLKGNELPGIKNYIGENLHTGVTEALHSPLGAVAGAVALAFGTAYIGESSLDANYADVIESAEMRKQRFYDRFREKPLSHTVEVGGKVSTEAGGLERLIESIVKRVLAEGADDISDKLVTKIGRKVKVQMQRGQL